MSFVRILFISLMSLLCLTPCVFAKTEKCGLNLDLTLTESCSLNFTATGNIEETLNKYIFDIYKFRAVKILQDLDIGLTKITLTHEGKKEAYTSIQNTLKLKKEEASKNAALGENAQKLLTHYLEYLIGAIEANKKKLS